MLHKEFWGILFLALVGWIFIASTPNERLERVCKPVGWTGNVVVSLSALVLPTQEKTVQGWFDKLEYGCRYTAWRLIYQNDYNKAVSEQQQLQGAAPSTAAPASQAVAPPSIAPQGAK